MAWRSASWRASSAATAASAPSGWRAARRASPLSSLRTCATPRTRAAALTVRLVCLVRFPSAARRGAAVVDGASHHRAASGGETAAPPTLLPPPPALLAPRPFGFLLVRPRRRRPLPFGEVGANRRSTHARRQRRQHGGDRKRQRGEGTRHLGRQRQHRAPPSSQHDVGTRLQQLKQQDREGASTPPLFSAPGNRASAFAFRDSGQLHRQRRSSSFVVVARASLRLAPGNHRHSSPPLAAAACFCFCFCCASPGPALLPCFLPAGGVLSCVRPAHQPRDGRRRFATDQTALRARTFAN